jgi:hypothetical protein
MKIWKLLSALLVDGILFISLPYALESLDSGLQVRKNAVYVLLITWFGLALTLLFENLASDEFNYHKHGYDFCIVTMGAALSTFSLQLFTSDNLLPNLPLSLIGGGPSENSREQNLALLIPLFLAACLAAVLTAMISREIKSHRAKAEALLSAINMMIGSSVLGLYVFLLVVQSAKK